MTPKNLHSAVDEFKNFQSVYDNSFRCKLNRFLVTLQQEYWSFNPPIPINNNIPAMNMPYSVPGANHNHFENGLLATGPANNNNNNIASFPGSGGGGGFPVTNTSSSYHVPAPPLPPIARA